MTVTSRTLWRAAGYTSEVWMPKAREKVQPSILRCPACGQPRDAGAGRECPLCGHDFGDARESGADVTPFAQAYATGRRGWQRMCEWVWFANFGRLRHLALIRSSRASRSFAMMNILVLAAVLGLLKATQAGWHRETLLAGVDAAPMRPVGAGWLPIASGPGGDAAADTEKTLHLWWNPPQTIIASVSAAVAAIILMKLVLVLSCAGLRLAEPRSERPRRRLTAALDYSTAWFVPVLASAVLLGMLPVVYVGRTYGWQWCPPAEGLLIAAGVLAAFGAAMWWFWLIRLAAAAPQRVRRRAAAFLAVGFPMIVAGACAAWWWGLTYVLAALFAAMNLEFAA